MKTNIFKIAIATLAAVALVALVSVAYGAVTIFRLRNGAEHAPILANNLYETAEETLQEPELYGEELLLHIKDNENVVVGDYLFYVNVEHNNYLYRVNLKTHFYGLYLQTPIFGVIKYEETLFFIAGTPPDSGIFLIDTATGHMQAIVHGVDINGGLRKEKNVIFYFDIYGSERGVLPCGRPVIV